MTPDKRLNWALAALLLILVVPILLSACGQPEEKSPTSGYTQTQEHMPLQFQGGAPGKLPTESEEEGTP